MAAPLSPGSATPLSSNKTTLGFRGVRFVSVMLSLTFVLCGCDTSPAARSKVKEARWRKGRVFGEIRILKELPRLLPGGNTDRDEDFATYRQTQARIITSQFVLQAAARRPELVVSRLLKNQPFPLLWLEQNLEVTFPATEFIRVSLKTDERDDSAQIVNAVLDAFITEVADLEQRHWRSRLQSLEKARHDLSVRNKTKTQRYRRLAEEIGATSEVALSQAESAMLEFYELLRGDLAREEYARSRDEFELKMLKDDVVSNRPNPEPVESSSPGQSESPEASVVRRLEESLHYRSSWISDLRSQLGKQMATRKSTAVHSIELEALQHEIQKDQEFMDLINEEITRAELEGPPEGRVTLFRRAEREVEE